jgi:nitroreductase
VAFLVEMADRAPSGHNTQPWQFRVQDSGLDRYADQARRAEGPAHGVAAAACAGQSRPGLPGAPQMLMQFGRAATAATARRLVENVIL